MSEPLRIGIILSSTRTGRFADKPASWLLELARKRTEVSFELVDLRDYPLPFFDEPKSPLRESSKHEVAVRWSRTIASLDGFIFVSGEYNHGIPAVLKNALDYLYVEFNRKAAAFVGYGNAGGARGIEQLRLNLIELQVAPVRAAVHLAREEFLGVLLHGKTLGDFPQLEQMAEVMLTELTWWAETLRAGRQRA
jgi:NAD(P)H-dependent FMN reductase